MLCAPWYLDPEFRVTRNYEFLEVNLHRSFPKQSLEQFSFSCCKYVLLLSFFIFLKLFCKYSVYIRKFCSVKTVCLTKWKPIRAVVSGDHSYWLTQLLGSLKSIRLGESVFNLWTDRKEALGFSECTDSWLAEYVDFYGSWPLYISRSLFHHSTFFVASLAFMKGTSYCVQ